MSFSSTATLESSAQRLFPDLNLDQIFARLLLERAQRNLVKYRASISQFETKYGHDFGAFRQIILSTEPEFEAEQDYFDWELAVTGVTDMETEIRQLSDLI